MALVFLLLSELLGNDLIDELKKKTVLIIDLKSKYDRHRVSLKDVCQGLTTFLLIAVVSAVVLAIADGPQRHAAVVGPAGKLSVVVTSIVRTHCGKEHHGCYYCYHYYIQGKNSHIFCSFTLQSL